MGPIEVYTAWMTSESDNENSEMLTSAARLWIASVVDSHIANRGLSCTGFLPLLGDMSVLRMASRWDESIPIALAAVHSDAEQFTFRIANASDVWE